MGEGKNGAVQRVRRLAPGNVPCVGRASQACCGTGIAKQDRQARKRYEALEMRSKLGTEPPVSSELRNSLPASTIAVSMWLEAGVAVAGQRVRVGQES